MKLKDLPEDQWKNLHDLMSAGGVDLDPEMTVEEAVALWRRTCAAAGRIYHSSRLKKEED